MPRILIVKLSSLGDVVHAMPAVQDIRHAVPDAQVDWVAERGFAPLAARCAGVARVIECELRRWSKSPLSAQTRASWRAFRNDLQRDAYDAVIDLQGLTKSALVSRTARLTSGGKRFALANRTEGSSYEAPTRWVADVAVRISAQVHAVERSRLLCAQALGYPVPSTMRWGLERAAFFAPAAAQSRDVVFIHGSSRDDKLWPESHWAALGLELADQGWTIGLPHGNDSEEARSQRLARTIGPGAQVWPRLSLDALTDRLACCGGAVGVDSGLSHIAVALDLPHVQIYNFDTAWRTGPLDTPRQLSVFARPTPSLDAVRQAWARVTMQR